MRLLITTVGLVGHFYPLVPLARAARMAGHEVLVAADPAFCREVIDAGLPVTASTAGEVLGGNAGRVRFVSAPSAIDRGRLLGIAARQRLPSLRRVVAQWRPDLVVSERAEFAGPIAAAEAGVRCVELRWSTQAVAEYRAGAEEAMGRGTTRPVHVDVVETWPKSLRGPHAEEHLTLRHLGYEGSTVMPKLMPRNTERLRVCVTFGTLVPTATNLDVAETIRGLAEELGAAGCEVLIAADDRLVRKWRPLPDSVVFAGRFPVTWAMRRCAAVVHHGGNGTSLAALAAGVPQVVTPVFDDQYGNAHAIKNTGAGVQLLGQEATPRRVALAAIEMLDDGAIARAARTVSSQMHSQLSPAQVVACLTGVGA